MGTPLKRVEWDSFLINLIFGQPVVIICRAGLQVASASSEFGEVLPNFRFYFWAIVGLRG